MALIRFPPGSALNVEESMPHVYKIANQRIFLSPSVVCFTLHRVIFRPILRVQRTPQARPHRQPPLWRKEFGSFLHAMTRLHMFQEHRPQTRKTYARSRPGLGLYVSFGTRRVEQSFPLIDFLDLTRRTRESPAPVRCVPPLVSVSPSEADPCAPPDQFPLFDSGSLSPKAQDEFSSVGCIITVGPFPPPSPVEI